MIFKHFFFQMEVVGIELGTSCMLTTHSASELYPPPTSYCFSETFLFLFLFLKETSFILFVVGKMKCAGRPSVCKRSPHLSSYWNTHTGTHI